MKEFSNRLAGDERCRFRPLTGGGLRMVLRLTLRCDLACPHCLAPKKKDGLELTTKQWKTLISQFSEIYVKKVLLTGGEPLLRLDLLEIVQTLGNIGIQTDLNSNLQRMDLDLIRNFKRAGLSEISVSLEGPEEIHDRMHGSQGAYRKLIQAIEWAASVEIPVDASCCLNLHNYQYVETFIRSAEALPIRSLTFSRLLPIGHGNKSQQNLTQQQLDACYQRIQHEITSGASTPIRLTGLLGAPRPNDCERGRSLAGISPDGSLLACVLTEDNPRISHPLKIGLKHALSLLQEKLDKRCYALCWQE